MLFFLVSTNTFAQDSQQIPLPQGAIARISKGVIYDIAFSPVDDPPLLVVASSTGIWFYDAGIGDELNQLTNVSTSSIVFSPDGNMLASGNHDGTCHLWQAETGKHLRKFSGHTDRVFSVIFNPQGQTLASRSRDGTVRLWNEQNGKLLRTIEGSGKLMSSLVFSPDGNMLASGCYDRNVYLLDTQNGKLRRLSGHAGPVYSVAFSSDGQILTSAGFDTVCLWNTRTGIRLPKLKGIYHNMDRFSSVAFSPEGQSLAIGGSGSNGFTVQLWDVRTAEWIRDLMSPTGTNTISRHLAFSPDGQILAAGLGAGRGVCLWSTQIGSLLQQFTTRELSKNINIDR